ncbi:GNAT family N-acetyltransferase [Tropicibacter sp. S64]|uniref:GNAT family N-acetyltransferase n=1 Tax=Tropicibacter sp. S64 TaxID=3415122 RepID=UPI003C7BCA9B
MTQYHFIRLTEVAPEAILAHMSDPRVADHMPLLTAAWDAAMVRQFIALKEATWARDGLGHWAILADGEYIGWGGFQREGEEWDFGLVLRPDRFGHGLALARRMLDIARTDPRIPFVTFLLPPSRRHLGALRRMGAQQIADIDYDGERFLKFRLETNS